MRLYNTLSSRLEKIESAEIRIYVCGITPYDHSHVGHARSAVVFDTLRRYLEYKGLKVKFVQNFTDVDDKIVKRAVSEGKSFKEIAEKYIMEYFEDVEKLNIKKADAYPKVTEHIKEIIEFVERLIEKGHAYVVDGDVYFSVPSFEKYGELSKQSLDELNKHRIEPDPRKRDVKDFALWKAAKDDDFKANAVFDSPWGKGRPGWHIECSVLSSLHLGVPFDIHGGGKDLIFPHHENERAQSYSLFNVEPVKIWVHNDFVTVKGEKMSKSLGNIVRIRDVLEKFEGEVLRYFLISAHYRSPLDYSEDALETSKKAYEKLKNTLINLDMEIAYLKTFKEDRKNSLNLEDFVKSFEDAMENDLNTPKALAALHEAASLINASLYSTKLEDLEIAFEKFKTMCSILGIFEKYVRIPVLNNELAEKILMRENARAKKNYELADKIRKEFLTIGLKLIDTKHGTRWCHVS
ncbi:MAG: cysteine--tRNA ligase [Archaeoglobaceae archaeon]|nr:cysteine--tRNA ligase [Archaeoglobaceae archaeon]MCX8151815.1 cysteine--tRNA ligase [Archaeoglobaceae archaeon]MDW8014353.1 cysteine--tRNA ligase [Archaeoglobaceae archaeon]